MILDALENLLRYEPLLPGLGKAAAWLAAADPSTRPEGRAELDGPGLAVTVSENEGRGRAVAVLEAHRRFIDVQLAVRGEELVGWLPLGECRIPSVPYDDEADIEFYGDAPAAWIALRPGWFCVLFPEDAHAPLGGEGKVRKAVFKVALRPGGRSALRPVGREVEGSGAPP